MKFYEGHMRTTTKALLYIDENYWVGVTFDDGYFDDHFTVI